MTPYSFTVHRSFHPFPHLQTWTNPVETSLRFSRSECHSLYPPLPFISSQLLWRSIFFWITPTFPVLKFVPHSSIEDFYCPFFFPSPPWLSCTPFLNLITRIFPPRIRSFGVTFFNQVAYLKCFFSFLEFPPLLLLFPRSPTRLDLPRICKLRTLRRFFFDGSVPVTVVFL